MLTYQLIFSRSHIYSDASMIQLISSFRVRHASPLPSWPEVLNIHLKTSVISIRTVVMQHEFIQYCTELQVSIAQRHWSKHTLLKETGFYITRHQWWKELWSEVLGTELLSHHFTEFLQSTDVLQISSTEINLSDDQYSEVLNTQLKLYSIVL